MNWIVVPLSALIVGVTATGLLAFALVADPTLNGLLSVLGVVLLACL